jgi:predicted nucleic acid-binding protein
MPIIVLDSSPLGILSHRTNHSPVVVECQSWLESLIRAGRRVVVPEIADYEVRRELLRAGKVQSVARLDRFIIALPDRYLPLNTEAVRLAAELWARVRRVGRATASDAALDGDALIAAQAILLGDDVVVATDNISHISRFVAADNWKNIKP